MDPQGVDSTATAEMFNFTILEVFESCCVV